MSITPVWKSTATALGSYGQVTSIAGTDRSLNASGRSLANSQIRQSQEISEGHSTGTQAALGQSYSQVISKTSIGQHTDARTSVQSSLSSYLQNSSDAANAASSGSLFKTSV